MVEFAIFGPVVATVFTDLVKFCVVYGTPWVHSLMQNLAPIGKAYVGTGAPNLKMENIAVFVVFPVFVPHGDNHTDQVEIWHERLRNVFALGECEYSHAAGFAEARQCLRFLLGLLYLVSQNAAI